MVRSRSAPLLAPLCVAAALAASCGAPFDPYWRVEEFRVLAIKSDPVVLEPGRDATLSALVYAAPGDDVSFSWSWCPVVTDGSNGFDCPFTRDQLAELLLANLPDAARDALPPGLDPAELLPSFDLGDGPTATLPFPGDPRAVRALCEAQNRLISNQNQALGGQVAPARCDRGLEVTVRLEATGPGGPIVSGKRVLLSTGPSTPHNANPDVVDLQIRLKDETKENMVSDELPWIMRTDPDGWYTLPADAVTPIKANLEFELRSLVDPDLVETFTRPTPVGADAPPPPDTESVTYRWFVSEGFIGDTRSLFKQGVSPASLTDTSITLYRVLYAPDEPDVPEQRDDWDLDGVPNDRDPCPWVTRESSPECEVKVWSVVRDGRLGLDWAERKLRVLPPE